MNKKFWLVMLAFTICVPGFFAFSYWFLGISSHIQVEPASAFDLTLYAGKHYGDYNKTGEKVVQTRRLFLQHSINCNPVLVYYENAIHVGKPYLVSAGGCATKVALPAKLSAELAAAKIEKIDLRIAAGQKITTYGQTAVTLRKVWIEIARLSDHGTQLLFPLVQIVRADGDNEFYIATK